MYICYLDESGVPENAGTTHFILLGLAIQAETWREKDDAITQVKREHRLGTAELHAGWMARRFSEQERIPDFDRLGETDRRNAVLAERRVAMNKAAARGKKHAIAMAKEHRKTEAFIHLTRTERLSALTAVADKIASWPDAVMFADAQLKAASRPGTAPDAIFDFAFEQVVSRFDWFLKDQDGQFGMVVQDRNETAANRLTYLMRRFHRRGTSWSEIERIVETPLFVDSELTSMVQLADVCSYATRRFFENNERGLFDRIYPRFHRSGERLVGLRHYTGKRSCSCHACIDHGRDRDSISVARSAGTPLPPATAPSTDRPPVRPPVETAE